MTVDKPTNQQAAKHEDHDIDEGFSLNHFDQSSDIEAMQDHASQESEPFHSAADLFADTAQPGETPEEEKEDPFDSTWGADRFAELGYGRQEPRIPRQPESPPPTAPAPQVKASGDPVKPTVSTSSAHLDPFTAGEKHTQSGETVSQPPAATSNQLPPNSEPPSSAPLPEQHSGVKLITVFALLAMLVAALAIWLNPGDKEQRDSASQQNIQLASDNGIRIGRLQSRLSALEQQSSSRNASLKQQIDHLAQQVSSLSAMLATRSGAKQSANPHPRPQTRRHQPPSTARKTLSKQQRLRPVAAAMNTGWVVNLVSVDSKYAASKALARYKAQGIAAEIFPTKVKGKNWYRLRISGFANKQEANAQKDYLATRFGIKDAWTQKP